MDFEKSWESLVFSDEKKFNLDGPAGYSYYWHALGTKSPILSTRTFGGGSLMICGWFDKNGSTELAFIEENINSSVYQPVLGRYLIPFLSFNNEKSKIFQQDNGKPHASRSTKDCTKERGIGLLDWPAYSHDLNPIENLWGILVQRVYANGIQFADIDELKETVVKE